MTPVFSLQNGDSPLLVSIPHDGRQLAPGQAARMTAAALELPDTDWHVRQLYSFVDALDATVVAANYSRYVVDLNRPANDSALYENQVSTGLCPSRTFAGKEVYRQDESVSVEESLARIASYWQPYHEQIARSLEEINKRHGYALLWDAHSIAGEVPRLFPGVLPDLNLGTNDGRSCAPGIAAACLAVANASGYTVVLNKRFRGGYITRHYGAPDDNVHAIQLELSQRNYMDENTLRYDTGRTQKLASVIEAMLAACMSVAHEHYR
jgi:N-formylglutamate amidohydrolase